MLAWLRSKFGTPSDQLPRVYASDLPPAQWRWSYDDGEKYAGGYGPTDLLITDYWTLRARSNELFNRDLYARGIIRRLVTNEINTGLHLEAVPDENILGLEDDALSDWSEDVEQRFHLWGKNPRACDYHERLTFGAIQAQARTEALVAGDVLVVLRQDQRTGLPRVQLLDGATVQTPINERPRRGNRIVHGVEIDPQGRQVGYWIMQQDGRAKRLPAFGERSGRRIAWLMYGTDKRVDDVRGKPLLSLVMQSLKEIGRYRDSVQAKARINATLAMFIKKTEDKPGTRPITGGAKRVSNQTAVDVEGKERKFKAAEYNPGYVIEELQTGEEPTAHPSHGTDEKFADFEAAVINAIAWANEIPPEILHLGFSNNYSASQAAINEFKIYLNRIRTDFGDQLCQHVYVEWLLSEVLQQKIDAPGLLEAWRRPRMADVFGAWTDAEWCGQIKPSTDLLKQARGYKMSIDMGLMTRQRAARELSGTKYSKNVKRLRVENEQLVEALEPLQSASSSPGEDEGPGDSFGEGGGEQDDEEREAMNVVALPRR